MADEKVRKEPKIEDPRVYAHIVEFGSEELGISGMNIPSRPLFGWSLEDFENAFQKKVDKVQVAILAAWS